MREVIRTQAAVAESALPLNRPKIQLLSDFYFQIAHAVCCPFPSKPSISLVSSHSHAVWHFLTFLCVRKRKKMICIEVVADLPASKCHIVYKYSGHPHQESVSSVWVYLLVSILPANQSLSCDPSYHFLTWSTDVLIMWTTDWLCGLAGMALRRHDNMKQDLM